MTVTAADLRIPRWESPVTAAEMSAGDGADCVRFFHRHYRIDKDTVGGNRGDLVRLRAWQQRQIFRVLARDPETGARKHRRGLIGIARKNTKSAIASGLALYLAETGPAGGEVFCCAGSKRQAGIVFRTAKYVVQHDPYLAERITVRGDYLEWDETGTILTVLPADADLEEGQNPTAVIFDEVHVQPDDRLWNVMALASGARVEPLMIGITTAGKATDRFGNDSIAYRLYQYGRRVSTGEISNPSFFFAWWEPDDPADNEDGTPGVIDHTDPAVWDQSNPGLGDLVTEADLQSHADGETPVIEFRTKRLNIWHRGGGATAVSAKRWASVVDRDRPEGDEIRFPFLDDEDERPAAAAYRDVPAAWLDGSILMLDGSWNGDTTGVVGCTRAGRLFVVTHYERDPDVDPDEWRVPISQVMADVRSGIRAGARGCLFDPFRWQHTMSELADEGIPTMEFPTSSVYRMVAAWKEFYDALRDGGLCHDGDLALARHVENMRLKVDDKGARPVKEAPGSSRHIDLGICAVVAFHGRNLVFDDGTRGRSKLWAAAA